MTYVVPNDVSQVMTALSIIGGIPHHKMNVESQSYTYVGIWQNKWMAEVLLPIAGETGQSACDHINATINLAVEASRRNPGFAEVIHDWVTRCAPAVRNLLDAYADNTAVTALLQIIEMRLAPARVTAMFEARELEPA
jgi:hypothetical protein